MISKTISPPALMYIEELLQSSGYEFTRQHHEPVTTVEAADKFCPSPSEGLKSLLLRVKGQERPVLVVLRGHDRLDLAAAKALLGGKVSFVPADEACALLGCDRGAIPPITAAAVQVVVDSAVLELQRVYFNPGINTATFGMNAADLERILREQRALVAKLSAVCAPEGT
jgi:prolyl-tRNA editing enzyme YbaK/EbsC (Cys-tRNA(Pro) deacylase)